MSEFQNRWLEVPLSDLTSSISNGFTHQNNPTSGGVPLSRIQTISRGEIDFDLVGYAGLREESVAKYLLNPGDILFSHINSKEHVGKVAIYKKGMPPLVHGMNLLRIVANARVIPEYLFWSFRSDFVKNQIWDNTRHAVNQASINIRNLSTVKISLAPLDEQRRIVETLDDHLSRLDKALAEIALVKTKSRLLVTAFLEQGIDSGPPSVRLQDLALSSGYGTSTKCVVGGRGVPVARIPNLVNGSMDMEDEKRAQDSEIDLSNLMLSEGDLLVIRTNGSQNLVGTTAVVPKNVYSSFASYLIRFKLDTTKVLPKWVHAMFGSLAVRNQIVELSASSAGQYNLGLSKLNRIALPVPSIEDQTKFLQELDKLTSHSDFLKTEQQVLVSKIETLRRTILNQAFTGGLVNA